MAASVGYGLFIDRDSGTFDFQIDYSIDGYNDPETGEYFGATSWSLLSGPAGGPLGGTGGPAQESETILLNFGLDPDPALRNYILQFSALNTFSGDSVAQNWNILTAAYAMADLVAEGTAGLDVVITGSGNDNLAGLDGNDHLDAGAGNDLLGGGGGGDLLDGGLGDDVMAGGAGDDLYRVDSADDIVVERAGEGNDAVQASVDYQLSGNVEGLTLVGSALRGTGSADANRLEGNGLGNRLAGLAGNDLLRGHDGDDTLFGGGGNDRLEGGLGLDTLFGGVGNDTYVIAGDSDIIVEEAGGGIDSVEVTGLSRYVLGAWVEKLLVLGSGAFQGAGNGHDNELRGGTGGDILVGGSGNDLLDGGAGADRLLGDAGADQLVGGAGIDTAAYNRSQAGVTVDLAAGTAAGGDGQGDLLLGIENVAGSDFADLIQGDGGSNGLAGGLGDDTIRGDAGNDRIAGGQGADDLDGGTGRDILSYAGAVVAVTVDLALGLASGGDAEGDLFTNFEDAEGGDGDDSLTGNGAANGLNGGRGEDVLDGGDGDDIITGGAGGDVLAGGAGTDWLSYAPSTARVVVDLAAHVVSSRDAAGDLISGFENARGGAGNDRIVGSAAANSLAGGAGTDSISGGGGDDVIDGGSGADLLAGGAGIDRLSFSGAAVGVVVNLGAGTTSDGDTLSGIEQAEGSALGDAMIGSEGNNVLYGRAGFDHLDGAGGHDLLSGGADGDVFVFGSGYGRDVIADFTHGADLLQIVAGEAFDTFGEVMAAAGSARGGSDTVITLAPDAVLVLRNVAIATLTPDDFFFG